MLEALTIAVIVGLTPGHEDFPPYQTGAPGLVETCSLPLICTAERTPADLH